LILDEVGEGALIRRLCFRSFEELGKEEEEGVDGGDEAKRTRLSRAQRARLLPSAGLCISDFKEKVLLQPPTITTDTAESMKRNIMNFCCLFMILKLI
jgi:hypothetical protein